MPSAPFRLVLDTNVVIRAFVNIRSVSGQILKACEERRVVPLLSKLVLSEYRAILRRTALIERYPDLTHPDIEVSLERLLYVSDFYHRIKRRFPFPRDPKDSPFLELAIAGQATHLVTVDGDLLALTTGRDEVAKRLRRQVHGISVLRPDEFIQRHGQGIR